MGLTINYSIRSTAKSAVVAERQVRAMHDLAVQYPFAEVGEVHHLGPDICQVPFETMRDKNEPFWSILLDAGTYAGIPWYRKQHASVRVQPIEVFHFWIDPGPGSEWAGIGLVTYPETVTAEYTPRSDDRFVRMVKKGCSTHWEFDFRKWGRHVERTFGKWIPANAEQFREQRAVPVRRKGWLHSGFCKTQYASNPEEGGIANFLRCHVALIHFLDDVARLKGVRVTIDDEGHYGPAHYSDDWREAYAADRKPTYVDHPATYSVETLVEQVGSYNELVAAFAGAMSDHAKTQGHGFESPIMQFQDFERLEFRGAQQADIQLFLRAMVAIADRNKAKEE